MNSTHPKVVIIDYHLGNLFSVKQACDNVGMTAVVSSDKNLIESADGLILPGVGAFSEAMKNLKSLDLLSPIITKAEKGTPVFGVCLGLQLLFSESEEFGIFRGIGLIEGVIKKFPSAVNNNKIKIPQIAWNKIKRKDKEWSDTPLKELRNEEYMYFVHSYYAEPLDNSLALTKTSYEGIEYCSAVLKNNIFATQFHPEKSSLKGLSIYKNWATINNLL